MSKAFASQADLTDKKISFTQLSPNAYAYTAEGDPNTGVIVGDDAVMVIDTQATPVMAEDVIRHVRTVTDKPIKYVVPSHRLIEPVNVIVGHVSPGGTLSTLRNSRGNRPISLALSASPRSTIRS